MISEKTSCPIFLINELTETEIDRYHKKNIIPKKETLEERLKKIAIIFRRGEYKILEGRKAELYEKKIIGKEIAKILKGQPAYHGVVRGRVRVISDPRLRK